MRSVAGVDHIDELSGLGTLALVPSKSALEELSDSQLMSRRMAQLQDQAQKQENENARLLAQLSKLQAAQEDLEGSFRKLDEENASLSAQLLDKSKQLVTYHHQQPQEGGGVSEKQLKKISVKFEKRVAALAAQRDAALHTARTSTEHLTKSEAELENAHAELRAMRAENVRMQALLNSTSRESQALEMLRSENRSLRSEHSDITARLEALHRMLDVSTRASGEAQDGPELEILRKKLSEAEVRGKRLAKESEDAQEKAQELSRQRDALALLMKRSQADAKDASTKLDNTQEQLAEEQGKVSELEAQLRRLKKDLRDAQGGAQGGPTGLSDLQSRIDQQEHELEVGRGLLSEAEKAIKVLEEENHSLTVKTEELLAALDSAEAALAAAEGADGKAGDADSLQQGQRYRIQQLEKMNDDLARKTKELEHQVRDAEQDRDRRSGMAAASAHAAVPNAPDAEEGDIRGELLMATASKDTLLQSMRDIHDATCRSILPAVVTLRLTVSPEDQAHQSIKFALHRDVCESLGYDSFAMMHVAYVSATGQGPDKSVSDYPEVVAGITFLPCAKDEGGGQPAFSDSLERADRNVVFPKLPHTMAHELVRQFHDPSSKLMSPGRITRGLNQVSVDLAISPEQLEAAASSDTLATVSASSRARTQLLAAAAADDAVAPGQIEDALSNVRSLKALLATLDNKYADSDSEEALALSKDVEEQLEQCVIDFQGLQARADTLEDLLLKAEDFLRSTTDHGEAEASEAMDSRPGSRMREGHGSAYPGGPWSYNETRDVASFGANDGAGAAFRDSLIPSEEDQWDAAFDQQLSTWEPDEGTDAESVSRYSARGSEGARQVDYVHR